MFARLVLGFLIALSSAGAFAQNQPELPFQHPDEILVDAFLFSKNVRLVSYDDIPTAVKDTLSEVDVAFEMGDGYYDIQANAVYEVTDPLNPKVVVGYMDATVLSYTEDPEYYLAILYVNPRGILLNSEWAREASPYSEEEIAQEFPPELQLPTH